MKFDKSIDAFKEILKINPDYYAAYSSMAYIYRQLNDYDNALLYAKKYLKWEPKIELQFGMKKLYDCIESEYKTNR